MSNKSSARMYAWFIFVLVSLAYLLVTFHRVSPAVMAGDIMRETDISAPEMGLLASAFFLAFGLMQLPSGILADTWGARKTLPLFMALAGLGSFLFAFGSSTGLLVAGRALAGFGVSVIFVCGVKLISSWFPVAVFARMNGLFLGVGGLGLILGSGPLAYLCELVGWRSGMMVCGAATLAIGALLGIFVRNSPAAQAAPSDAPPAPRPSQAAAVKRIFASPNFWLIALWFCCQFGVHMAFGGLWGGTYLVEVRGLSRTESGNILLLMGLGMIVGAPFNGWLSDVVFKAGKPVMLINSFGTALLFLILHQWGETLPVAFFYFWFFCLAAFGMGSLSVGFAAMRHMFGAEAIGTASGFLNTFPSFAVALLQTVTGWILQQYPKLETGFSPEAYQVSCILYAGAAGAALIGAALAKEVTPDSRCGPA